MAAPTELREDWREPAPDRLSPLTPGFDRILAAHREAMTAGRQGYMDPTSGLFVMTAEYLASRRCCDNGCRHCPWRRDV
ncbi:MAG: hypothetical protein GX868_06875 [Actinobacteria bacterium]|nr:hypothetical protein [Actinomycetota bacterium]